MTMRTESDGAGTLRIARMRLSDLDTGLDWAALEGWNPGLDEWQ